MFDGFLAINDYIELAVKKRKAVTLRSAKKGKAKKQEPCGDSSASDTKEFGSQLMVRWSWTSCTSIQMGCWILI